MPVHSEKPVQIKVKIYINIQSQNKVQVKALIFSKTSIIISTEYFNYNNVFLAKNTIKLLEYTETNNHAIKVEKDKQLLFNLIYSLGLVEFEVLKIYIKINLANSFI